ncbi:GL16049 [Drosophila persimilis]|uniref:GL16049 n=1 Tax=Drosophila persimilis TaxID=7234 RepID=B4GQG9_DROPE|nr:zinc finger protein 134 [Drosophila persimilis]EDW39841.1 GL16049 [Drosophila persimilis]
MAEVCRICKAPPVSGPLKNIFDEPQNSDTCIADMIAECSGHEVCRGDLLPENICPPCLEDAVAAFSFKKTCEQSHKPNFPVLEEAGGEAICGNQEDDAAWEPSDSGNELTNQLETDAKVQGDKDVYHQFKCSLCPKSYKHKSNLNRHKNVHTGIRPHKCSDCSKAFRLKTYLQAHIRTHTDERPYKCEHCSKTFKHKKSLKNHSRTHSEERPHKCMHCSKSFSHSGTFRNHVRTHTVERSFQCSDCSKAFKRQSDLNKHSRTHSVDRPYQCVLCSKSFKFKWHLSRHLRTHTEERPYSCADCPKAFKDKSSLKNHTCCRSQNDR